MAEDITVLQQYLTPTTSERQIPPKLYNTISTGPGGRPVVYLTLPKKRRGLRNAVDPGRAQREIIENVLGPCAVEVRKTYFEHLHPCFPVVDEMTFLNMWRNDSDRISPTLVCDLYASALQVWSRSHVLRHQVRPDPHFIWNQAVIALQDDFMAPTISTVHAAVLDLLGRPVIGVTGNIVNAGRIVTLAQSLGLHRDPSSWNATAHEKSVRINLWWGILVHDYWSSIGHGTPPTISPNYHDVPLPSFSDQMHVSLQTFVQLCKLSRILGDILPLVYSLRETSDAMKRQLRKVECSLDDWVVELPAQLEPTCEASFKVNGGSNLWFAYLSMKVLVCRVSFKAVQEATDQPAEARQYHLAMLKDAALEATHFITSLTEAQFQEFWMPYTSYLLVTSATILLRCTIESNDLNKKKACVTQLVAFRERLRTARDALQWDLAEFCLERCDEPIQRIADALVLLEAQEPGLAVPHDLSLNDLFLPVDSLDYPWETLWNGIEGLWSVQI
ncbi:uncharacterized protein M421DRAFT_5608 [Didymella exigua CBS 183.55]|uniref:Xylanolytic transcriptional activator regulatory domain-containing protein n=1 Tax=Didymella exigua CBS 183.55 TaxID=1150837 RepID=A0A6A5RJF0_9PLEO|nr:uncharacterized protein M421DRAFT_5608 [Didymella exigua CBS 183.55]KAF1927942.1 hypothetical protein M421DRAFT_5608 [Didymella exigua CBS 183.55]